MLRVEVTLLIFLSLAREQSQVMLPLFLGLMSPLAPISRVVWCQWKPFSLMSLTRVAYLSSFLTLAPSAPESHGKVSSTRSTLVGVSTRTRSGLLVVVRMSGGIVTTFTLDPSKVLVY